jgi:hypothetical protein
MTHNVGHGLYRYYRRALVGCCVPLIITVYYLLTWTLYLSPTESPNGIRIGRAGARLILYTWYVLGVIGLDLGEYGLLGVEASMLMNAFWAAPNDLHIMIHGEHSWNGIDGWINAIKSIVGKRRRTTTPTKLWWVLALLTALLFVGLPLTGLTMELRDGFRISSDITEVVGQRWETFNQRSSFATLAAAHNAWSLAVPPRVPGIGVLYTNSSANRNDESFKNLNALPNTIPIDEGVNELFLIPQASTPISGKSWGLIVRYNCTIIQRLEDFMILSRRNASRPLRLTDPPTPPDSYKVGEYSIEVRNITVGYSGSANYKIVSELGYSNEVYGDAFFASQNTTQCYFNKSIDATNGYPGLEHESILELAFWQHATSNQGIIYPPLPPSFYNFSMDASVIGLNGAYSALNGTGNSLIPMNAIGVQCKSSSALGTAEIDGTSSTYKNFEKSDTPIVLNFFACPPRLSLAVPQLIFLGQSESSTWSEDFFTSAEAPPTLLTSMSGDNVVYVTVRPTLLQASELRRSLLRAYGTIAAQLMYNGGQGYSFARSGHQYRFNNTNATAFVSAQVLSRGLVPPVIPGVLLVLWALGTCFLSLFYGFNRRWAETLDSYSLFQFGGDLSDQVKEIPYLRMKDFKDHDELRKLPGLIGDSKPHLIPGHITLVPTAEALTTKKYV